MNISKKQMAKIVLLLALLFLLLPSSLRAIKSNVYLMGDESYYHARIAKEMIEEGLLEKDSYVFNARDYVLNPYHVLLAGFALLFGVLTASKLLPLLLGLLCVYLFYAILKDLKIDPLVRFAASGIFILSPVFIYAFNISGSACFILSLNLAGLFFLMKKSKASTFVSLLCFGIASMFGILHALVSAVIVLLYSFCFKRRLKKGYLILAAVVFVMLSYSLPVYLNLEKVVFASPDKLSSFVADIGGIAGFSIFAVLLAVLGYVLVWRYKKKYYFIYVFSFLLIVYSFFNNSLLIYSNIVLAFLAGVAFTNLAKMRWKLKVLRNFTLLILFCGLLFSAVNASVALQDIQPSPTLINGLIWLNLNSGEEERVFSHYSNGFWIEFISDRPVILDGLLEQTPNVNNLYFDSNELFQTTDIDLARKILSKYDVKYIVITDNMRKGLVWDKEGKGLDFLLSNAETFKKVQENSYVTIYEYVYGGL